jgi:hypothetical protein
MKPTESRSRIAAIREDEYWNELIETGQCKALDINLPQLYLYSWRKYADTRFCAVGGYLCDLINKQLDEQEWQ